MRSGPRDTNHLRAFVSLPVAFLLFFFVALVVVVSGPTSLAAASIGPGASAVLADGDRGPVHGSSLVESDPALNSATPSVAGAFSRALPRHGRTAFVVWNGGPIDQLLAAAIDQGCTVRSVWVMTDGGRFVGYRAGAPDFVNAQWVARYPSDIPGPTPVLVVCAEVSVAMLPDTVTALNRIVIGRSVQGRPIEVACVGEGLHLVLLVGGMHTGTEKNTVTIARRIMDDMAQGRLSIPLVVQLCVLPVLNPDGLIHDERTNANGVDLNRNWPSADWQPDAFHPASGPVSGGARPLSEPETQALSDFVRDADPAIVIVWHSYAALVDGNGVPLARKLGRAYAEASGLDYLEHWDPYPITGQFIDAMEEQGVAAIDVELRWSNDSGSDAQVEGVQALLVELASTVRE
ncbi:MAG: DUF2817 domain-containing protein [Chloroflexi bacterium]|nr:DUF2817 domain-containing protein [Chloroflexota bacterium]